MWHCVAGLEIPHVSKQRSSFIFSFQSKGKNKSFGVKIAFKM